MIRMISVELFICKNCKFVWLNKMRLYEKQHISFVFEFEHAFSFNNEFFLTNIYFPQTCMILYNDIIHTHKQKLNANKLFL